MTTRLLAKRLKTYKVQLRYKKTSRWYGTFYVDYIKVVFKSMRQFLGGTLYTTKLGFKKFFPCSNKTSVETVQIFRVFIELVGLPPTLHPDNHKNFKEGIFKWLLQNVGIIPAYTDPHSPCQNIDKPEIGEVKRHARKLMTWSSPRCPLHSHSLVCIKIHLFNVEIGPIINKELEFIFRSDRSDRRSVFT